VPVLTARAIEERPNEQTWFRPDFDLSAGLRRLHVLTECGHFAYLERPDHVEELVGGLLDA